MHLPRTIRTEQEAIVDRIVASGHTRRQIAEAAGVDHSMPSKWTTDKDDGRVMTALELLKIADRLGYDVVLGSTAAAAGFRIEPVDVAGPAAGLQVQAARLVAIGAEFSSAVAEALADGRVTEDERDDLERRHTQLLAETRRVSLRSAS